MIKGLFCLFLNLAHGGVEFELRGLVSENDLSSRQDSSSAQPFTIWSRSPSWLVSVIDSARGGGKVYYEIGGNTAQNLIHQTAFFPDTGVSTGRIESNAVPVDCMHKALPILWLALASMDYLDTITNDFLTPVYDASAGVNYDQHLKRKAVWKRYEAPPRFAERITFFSDADGRTNAVMSVLETTSSGGMTFPRKLKFEQPNSNPPLRLYMLVDYYSPTCSRLSLLPALRHNTGILDKRLMHSKPCFGPVSYTIRRPTWTTVEDVLRIYQRQLRESGSLGAPLTLVLFTIALLTPIVFIACRSRAKEQVNSLLP